MKKEDLIMKILISTNFKFFSVFEGDVFFNLEELIEQKCKDKFFAFKTGVKTKNMVTVNQKFIFIL